MENEPITVRFPTLFGSFVAILQKAFLSFAGRAGGSVRSFSLDRKMLRKMWTSISGRPVAKDKVAFEILEFCGKAIR